MTITFSGTNFIDDIHRGHIGESIFIDDFLNFLKIKFQDVTGNQGFQIIDADMLCKIGLYEIKTNYKDDKQIIIEEFTNVNPELGAISKGWFYKSKADTLVFISKDTRTMILIPFTDEFRKHYEATKNNYKLIWNKISIKNNTKWQSAFRKIPLSALNGHFAYYKKVS
jgi:hypothetical protein